jgi:hypothetical protein
MIKQTEFVIITFDLLKFLNFSIVNFFHFIYIFTLIVILTNLIHFNYQNYISVMPNLKFFIIFDNLFPYISMITI